MVNISPASGPLTAGQVYSLTCSVQVVDHLVVEPSVEWTRQNGSQVTATSGTSLLLNFNPQKTSDGNNYTCTATVNVPSVVTVNGEESRVVVVSSK